MKLLREALKKLLEEEKHDTGVQIEALSLEEALQKACDDLGTDLSGVEYEIEEFGSKGFFGLGSKKFKVKVFKAKSQFDLLDEAFGGGVSSVAGELSEFDDVVMEERIVDKDGESFVKVTNRGALLKVTSPIGSGTRVSESDALELIKSRGITNFDPKTVKSVVKQATGEYVRIGSMQINVVNDSTASVQITSDETKSYIIITPPKPGGFDIDLEELRTILQNNGVTVGIKEDVLSKLFDYPIYNEPVLVALFQKPKDGRDAVITYNFQTDREHIELKEVDGKIDFKELNLVQNVVAGQILATKEPPAIGEAGRTVTNKIIPARLGKDIPLTPGKNTKLSEDKLQIISEINGQVLMQAGKVTVEPVFTVPGDVNLKTGNILFLGNVIIKGNVEDGFSVKAAGNIEIAGAVGRSVLDAEGDIVVSGGIQGKGDSHIRTGKSLYAKFVESANIDAMDGVYVQDGILHSYIDAVNEIVCIGKRGAIVGGHIRAGKLVKTKTLGSVASPETIIETGIDPKKRQRMKEVETMRDKTYKELEPLKTNLATLENQKKVMKKLSDEKEEQMKNLAIEGKKLKQIISQCEEEIEELNKYFNDLKSQGRIVASKIAYPGVKLYIKNSYLLLKTEYKKNSFILQNNEVFAVACTEDDKK